MRCLLTITSFTLDPDLINYIATDYIHQIGNKLNYNIIKSTCGKHVDASRAHYHTHVCYDCSGAKVYKVLNEKISRMFSELTYPSEEIAKSFNKIENKISFIYEGQNKKFKKKIVSYSESSMCYCFKEYQKNEEIPVCLQFGFSKGELDEMRMVSNVAWREVVRKRNQQKQLEISNKDSHINFIKYLEERMVVLWEWGDVNDLVTYVKKQIYLYKKEEYKKGKNTMFRVSCVRDQAISFLFYNNYIDEDDIPNIK